MLDDGRLDVGNRAFRIFRGFIIPRRLNGLLRLGRDVICFSLTRGRVLWQCGALSEVGRRRLGFECQVLWPLACIDPLQLELLIGNLHEYLWGTQHEVIQVAHIRRSVYLT